MVYSNQQIIKGSKFNMEALKPSLNDSSINSKYAYILQPTSRLTIPLVRCDDQVLNKVIKQENIEENDHNNDDTILQIGNAWTIKKEANTTNINIKTERDIIEAFTFDGSVLNEDCSLEIIDRLNLRENTLTSNTANLTRLKKIHISEMKEPLICAMCNKIFYKKSGLKIHILRHARENSYNNRVLCYNCNICGKRFSQAKLVETHMRRLHTKGKPHICDFCNKGFATRATLKNHTRVHTGEKPYKCDVCNYEFSLSGNLTVHKRIHTGEKPYKCPICDKRFNQVQGCNRHLRTHTNDKPYQCDICKKSFSRSYNLKIHTTTHTEEKPYKCQVCDKSFALSRLLRLHAKRHTSEKPFKCNFCDKAFYGSTDFIRHTMTHSNDKPHKCDICNREFGQPRYKKKHMKIHEGEKSYQCVICNKWCSRLGYLKMHKKIHLKKPFNTISVEAVNLEKHTAKRRTVKRP